MKSRLLVAFAVVAAAALAAAAQQPGPERRVFAVSVVDAYGRPVEGLTAANFRGKHRGKSVKILSAELDSSPRDIGVVVDLAPSLEDRGGLPLAWAAARDAILALTPTHRMALFTIEEGVNRLVDFTDDRHALLEALDQARARPVERTPTLLVSAVEGIAKQFPRDSWGGVLFLISDAASHARGFSPREAEEALARAGVRVFAVWVNELELRWLDAGRGTAPRQSHELAENLCRRLAAVSGGLSIQLRPKQVTVEQVPGSLGSLYRPLASTYRVEVEFPKGIEKGGDWELEIVDERGQRRQDVVVAYPRLLVP